MAQSKQKNTNIWRQQAFPCIFHPKSLPSQLFRRFKEFHASFYFSKERKSVLFNNNRLLRINLICLNPSSRRCWEGSIRRGFERLQSRANSISPLNLGQTVKLKSCLNQARTIYLQKISSQTSSWMFKLKYRGTLLTWEQLNPTQCRERCRARYSWTQLMQSTHLSFKWKDQAHHLTIRAWLTLITASTPTKIRCQIKLLALQFDAACSPEKSCRQVGYPLCKIRNSPTSRDPKPMPKSSETILLEHQCVRTQLLMKCKKTSNTTNTGRA
jgi:hypothetical protein